MKSKFTERMSVLILEGETKTAYHPIFHAYEHEQTDLFYKKETKIRRKSKPF